MRFRVEPISGDSAVRQYSRLLDECFSVPAKQKFLNDFPVWNPVFGCQPVQRLGIFKNEELLSTVSARIAELKTPGQKTLKVSVIGGVATRGDSRGLGLASQGIQAALQWSKEQEAALVLLWGSELSFYQKFGFELCGFQMRLPVEKLGIRPKVLSRMSVGWNPKIFSFLQSRQFGLKLRDWDRNWYESHENVRWFWISDEEGSLLAYAALGRGIDLEHTIHEWGGRQDELNLVLSHILALDSQANLLLSPHHLKLWNLEMKSYFCEGLAMAQVLRPNEVLQAYFPNQSCSAIQERNRWQIQMEAEKYIDLTSPKMTQLILGALESPVQNQSSFFPILWWIWGLDAA